MSILARAFVLVLISGSAAPALAQNYRLSSDIPSDWNEHASRFVVAGDQVVFEVRTRGAPTLTFGALWSAPVAGGAEPRRLHPEPTMPMWLGELLVTADGAWVVTEVSVEIQDRILSRLFAARVAGGGAHFLNDPVVDHGVRGFALTPDSRRVVYVSDEDTRNAFELYSREIGAPGPALRLSGAPLAAGDVLSGFRISPDGARVVYLADHQVDEVVDLWSVPVDGSAPPVRLNTSRPLADVQPDIAVSQNGLGVVYRADTDVDETFELFVADITGTGAPVKRSGTLVPGGDVVSFTVGPDDARLFYVADALADDVFELFSVPALSGSPAKLSGTMTSGGDVLDHQTSPDGQRVVFSADRDTDGTVELYVVAASGGTPQKLHAALGAGRDVHEFAIAPDSSRVAFTANLDVFGRALYSVPLDASASPVRLSAVPVNGQRRVDSFRFAAGGTRIVYASDQALQGLYELHGVPADGSAAPVKLNGPLASGGPAMLAYEPTANGHVVYAASQAIDTPQIWSVPVTGGPTRRLSPPLERSGTGEVLELALPPDGERVVYTTSRRVYNTATRVFDLWSVALDEPLREVRLCGPNASDTYLDLAGVSPDGRWAAYSTTAISAPSELFIVPSDGRAEPVRLGPAGASAQFEAFTPDSSQVVFRADGLRSSPVDGDGASVLLASGDVVQARVGPDGSRVVYLKSLPTRHELWSVPTLGGAPPTRLDGPLVTGGSVRYAGSPLGKTFQISPDGTHVVYIADQETDEVVELFCAPIDGSGPAVKLNGPMVAGGDVLVNLFNGPPFEITPDGAAVVYLADQETDEKLELFSAPLLGGGPSTKISGSLTAGGDVGGDIAAVSFIHSAYQVTEDGTRVVFMADAALDDRTELFSVPRDGSEAPVRLGASLPFGSDVFDFGIAPGAERVVYRIRSTRYAIHSAPIGGGASVQLADHLEFVAGYGSTGGSHGFVLTPDGAEVLFAAHPHDLDTIELFRAPLDGSRPAAPVNGPLVAGGEASGFDDQVRYELTRDGGRVIYVADQDRAGLHELFATFLGHRPRRSTTPVVR